MTELLLVLLGLLLGLLAAFYGAGGGWAVVPVLMWLERSAVVAVGTSLAMVAATGGVALWQHARHGSLRWREFGWMASACAVGAELGRRCLLMSARAGEAKVAVGMTLAVVLLVAALSMITNRADVAESPAPTPDACRSRPWIHWVAFGVPLGLVGGVSGLGGGLLAVPWLTLHWRLDHRQAVPLSLGAVAATGVWGAIRYGVAGEVDWKAAACLAAGSLLGAQMGARACRGAMRGRFLRAFGALLGGAALALLFELGGWTAAARGLLGLILAASSLMVIIEWSRGINGSAAHRRSDERASSPNTG